MIEFLQQNAEWMCAIAIATFAGVQCYLTHQQTLQNLRFKRLELATHLDEVAEIFLGDIEHAKKIQSWLAQNASNFAFLLNSKDLLKYKELCAFLYNYHDFVPKNQNEIIEKLAEFTNLLSALDEVLGSATYGFVKKTKELKPIQKQKEVENN